MSARAPHITDHAVRRFLERVLGLEVIGDHDGEAIIIAAAMHSLDLELIRLSLQGAIIRGVALGATAILHGRFRYVLRAATLVTIEPQPGKFTRARRPRQLE